MGRRRATSRRRWDQPPVVVVPPVPPVVVVPPVPVVPPLVVVVPSECDGSVEVVVVVVPPVPPVGVANTKVAFTQSPATCVASTTSKAGVVASAQTATL